jgi:hypothetical protein
MKSRYSTTQEVLMDTKRLTALSLTLALCMGAASAQQFLIKKEKLMVTVEQDSLCPGGISVSGDALRGRHLCAGYPREIGRLLQKFVGSSIEMEALWTFINDPNSTVPVALGEVSMVGTERVDSLCTSKAMETAMASPSSTCNISATPPEKNETGGQR